MSMLSRASGVDSTKRYYLTFQVGNQWYAVDVQEVFEVAQMVTIASVPDMPEAILGVVNVRGSIVPVLDLRIRFQMPKHDLELTTPIIFIQHEPRIYGMIVDDVDDVLQISDESIRPTELQQRADHIQGLTDHHGRLIMIIDPLILLSSSLKGQSLEELSARVAGEIE